MRFPGEVHVARVIGTEPNPPHERSVGSLSRVLNTVDLVLLVLGVVIGSGIFIVPALVLRQVGGSGLALTLWLLGGVLSVMGALTYGELAASYPASGGLYAYIREAFGAFAAFLYGWALLAVIGSGAIAALSVAFVTYLRHLVPLGAFTGRVVPAALILAIGVINVSGTRRSVGVQNWLTVAKVGGVLLMAGLLNLGGSGLGEVRWWPDAPNEFHFAGIVGALIAVLWAYEGWQYVTFSLER
jgi:APA family basic amino acid/polyamine antiporter